jgi:short-subunit dehydrogenase
MIARGWGRVVNLSSAAFEPGPHLAECYATRAYVLSLSVALAEEVRGTGVRVTALCPGPARSPRGTAGEGSSPVPRLESPDVAELAAWGYRQVKRGRTCAVQGPRWRAYAFGTRLLPRTTALQLAHRTQRRVLA